MKKILKTIQYNQEYQVMIVIAVLILIAIPLCIYCKKNASSEVHYTTGIVIDHDRWTTTDTRRSGDDVYYETTTHYETQVKVDEGGYIFTDSSYSVYSHTVVGETVNVRVQDNYWKGKYIGTIYSVRR